MKFSICIPVYNTERYLSKCLDSILIQDFMDYEVLIVDDGSPDNSRIIADRYAKNDGRIRVIHQKNAGLFHARISALKQARGDYIIHIDSDDWIEERALRKIADITTENNVDIVLYNNYIVYQNGKKKKETALGETDIIWKDNADEVRRVFFNTDFIQAIWKKAIRRELINIEALENLPRITMTEDWIHSFYPITMATSVAYIADALYNYQFSDGSMTAVFDPLIITSTKIIYDLRKDYEKQHPRIMDSSSEKWFIEKIAKTLIYNRAEVVDKEKYYQYLKVLREDKELYNTYEKNRRDVGLIFRLPLSLLFREKFDQLYFLKSTVAKLRKNIHGDTTTHERTY